MRRWPDTLVEQHEDAIVGAHAFDAVKGAHRIGEITLVAVDGEWSLYREAAELCCKLDGDVLDPDIDSAGNVAMIGATTGTVHLAADPSGTFPLYYKEHEGGLLFASLLRPLAAITHALPDDIAILEFLRQAYTVGGKTVYADIRRLLPGQSLTYHTGRTPTIHERSRAWTGSDPMLSGASGAEQTWERLQLALSRSVPAQDGALMMSGGWDSRTLLAGLEKRSNDLLCYSHGDIESRELTLVQRLCAAAGTRCWLEPIDDRVLDPDLLLPSFDLTENVVFPHWHRAGAVLAEKGTRTVSAGVFGEILGGHYGPAMLAGGMGKARSVGGMLLGLKGTNVGRAKSTAREFLRAIPFGRHWYLRRDYEEAIGSPRERMNAAIESALDRLEARGVRGDVPLVEAFISEHRGAQYINAQLLSCRSHTDIALPFAGRELFEFSTRVPLEAKIHNRLNREVLATRAPHLLKTPMAATLVPASWPLIAQEASRAARKIYEHTRMEAYRRTGGRIPRPHLGWVNFDFVRNTALLSDLADQLEVDIWDRESIRRNISLLADEADPRPFHPFFDQFAKIVSVDLLLR